MADFLSGRSKRPGREQAPAVPVPQPATPAPAPAARSGGGLDLGSSGLDLGNSSTPPAPAPVRSPAPVSSSLDLGSSSDQLPKAAPRPTTTRHTREEPYELALPTITEHHRQVLDENHRVVHLTRMQSAAGKLIISPALGAGEHLDLACAMQTREFGESIVLGTLNRQGPDPRRPLVRCGGQGVEVDLRRIHSFIRFLVIGVTPQLPGGTLVVTTYGGSRMEIALPTSRTLGAQALLTAYVVQGRLVLRAELDPFSGTLQQVCGAYGYSDLTWRDAATPLL